MEKSNIAFALITVILGIYIAVALLLSRVRDNSARNRPASRGQKSRFLPAANSIGAPHCAESAASTPPRRQKSRFLPAAQRSAAPNSAESAASTSPRRQKPRFLPAAQRSAAPNSAESAAGDFQPIKQ